MDRKVVMVSDTQSSVDGLIPVAEYLVSSNVVIDWFVGGGVGIEQSIRSFCSLNSVAMNRGVNFRPDDLDDATFVLSSVSHGVGAAGASIEETVAHACDGRDVPLMFYLGDTPVAVLPHWFVQLPAGLPDILFVQKVLPEVLDIASGCEIVAVGPFLTNRERKGIPPDVDFAHELIRRAFYWVRSQLDRVSA